MNSDVGNGGVIDQSSPICGWVLEAIMETVEISSTKSPTTRQGRGITTPTSQTGKSKALVSKAHMRTTPPHGTTRGFHVEQTPHVTASNHIQALVGSPGHDGFREHTHSSPTSRFMFQSQEIFSEVSASTVNALIADGNQENHVWDFKKLINSQ